MCTMDNALYLIKIIDKFSLFKCVDIFQFVMNKYYRYLISPTGLTSCNSFH